MLKSDFDSNFSETFNTNHNILQEILNKYLFILTNDPYLKGGPPQENNLPAPSKLKRNVPKGHIRKKKLNVPWNEGRYRCGHKKFKCCDNFLKTKSTCLLATPVVNLHYL